jgi:hypothetical protein
MTLNARGIYHSVRDIKEYLFCIKMWCCLMFQYCISILSCPVRKATNILLGFVRCGYSVSNAEVMTVWM